MSLIERLKRREGRVVVVGIGYVGLPKPHLLPSRVRR